ncbi:MAG: AbrB/MazE/SpoVT family DNA-binding domain-containing protein [Deinococcota bacterium]|jgi:AbrB family looped-hinge helix DNA binding protein|nr:AbrB/MazE/SpoVT family DNA-binding domain-containing protein [Deinococcota bacterium]
MAEYRTKVAEDGHLVIPAPFRKALGVKPGDEVILSLEGGEVRVFTPEQGLRRAQMLVRKYVPRDRRLADELIDERRREVARGEGGS